MDTLSAIIPLDLVDCDCVTFGTIAPASIKLQLNAICVIRSLIFA
jgi:hypothetical protein